MKERRKELIKKLHMKNYQYYGYITGLLFLVLTTISCKTQNVEKSIPFTIEEKHYFYWIGGKQGTEGTTIRIEGSTTLLNISFSKIFFQNHEYGIVPDFRSGYFILEGSHSKFRDNITMTNDPAGEYGNKAPQVEKKIPFDIEDDEAILLYSLNGREEYHKITGIKQLDKVYRP